MAEKKRAGESASPPSCQVAWLRRRRELEETPVTRVEARPAAGRLRAQRPCPMGGALASLLEGQNRLLYDILEAVDRLAAAQASDRRS